jgi:hypothetical protein
MMGLQLSHHYIQEWEKWTWLLKQRSERLTAQEAARYDLFSCPDWRV